MGVNTKDGARLVSLDVRKMKLIDCANVLLQFGGVRGQVQMSSCISCD